MKRMKKKVVAMVTLAMFIMTLLPMAAFAAIVGDTENCNLSVDQVVADASEFVKVTAEIKDAYGNEGTVATARVWAEDEDGTVLRTAEITAGRETSKDGVVTVANIASSTSISVKFNKAGTYRVVAAQVVTNPDDTIELVPFKGATDYVTVTGDTTDVTGITVNPTSVTIPQKDLNGVTRNKVTATVTANGAIVPDTVLEIATNDNDIKVVDVEGKVLDQVKVKATTSSTQNVDFYVVGEKGAIPGAHYEVTLTCNGKDVVLPVYVKDYAKDKVAATIEAIEVDEVLDSANNESAKKVQFAVKNAAGEKINVATSEPMVADVDNFLHEHAVKVTGPVKVDPEKISFAYDKDSKNMQMTVTGDFKDVFKKAGEYSVTATLKNGQAATVTFSVDKFGKVADLVIEPNKDTTGNKIVLDKTAADFKVYPVDEKGIKGAALDATNNAVKLAFTPVSNDINVVITPKNGATADSTVAATLKKGADASKVIGTKVNVTAAYTVDGRDFFAAEDFVVVDNSQKELLNYELAFDKTEGNALKYNEVTPTVVNKEDPTNKKLNKKITKLYAEVLSQSNKNADVNVKVNDKNKVVIYSNMDTTVDIQVVALVDAGNGTQAKFADTLTFKVGAVQAPVDSTLVAMTIGSTDMVVNNVIMPLEDKSPAAPYVKNSRTYVPVNALSRAFGADVEWNEKDRTVSVTLDGNEIVMTIGQKDYTLNGEKATMDVAPEISNNRTMVPVRFVAEALGFKVTPLYSVVDGTTESVVFQK